MVKRRRVPRAQDCAPLCGLTLLEAAAVRPTSAESYRKTLQAFTAFCQSTRSSWGSEEELDAVAVAYLTALYLDGEGSFVGDSLIAALRHVFTTRTSLPRTARALKGWRKLAPSRQRLPLPRPAMMAVAGWLMHQGQTQMAAAVALAFSAYLRPAELMALRVGHLVPPCLAAQLPMWGLLLHDSDLGVPGKTGMYDAAVSVDLDEFLWPVLAALRLRRQDSEEVWSFTVQQLRLNYKQACAELSLQGLSDHLYGLRHGGASHDLLHRRRDLLAIRERGRWVTDSSLRRYAKSTLLQRELNKIPQQVIAFGNSVERQFVQLLVAAKSGRGFPLPVPTLPVRARARGRR